MCVKTDLLNKTQVKQYVQSLKLDKQKIALQKLILFQTNEKQCNFLIINKTI